MIVTSYVMYAVQDSEEDYEEEEEEGGGEDGEYGDGDGDPCPNCGRKYRCKSTS